MSSPSVPNNDATSSSQISQAPSPSPTIINPIHDPKALFKYPTYEDYLDEKINTKDLFYLENQDLARAIIENEYKRYNILSRDNFEEQKKKYMLSLTNKTPNMTTNLISNSDPGKTDKLCSFGKDLRNYPLLNELAKREAKVRSGRLNTIIFIRDYDKKGNEVSGYIDYGHRLKNEDFEEYFSLKKRLMPKTSDLSYYNWKTQTVSYNNSSTFQVIANSENGLFFRHRRDRKVISVDPKSNIGDNSERRVIKTDEYLQVVLYEHRPRRKN
ncbi:hypothetical protein NAEGRDRAFT_34729 [Naegleria gruberi]|uniref:Cilia- and flagella-associated protein 299 n=1 Tax=Naegleria gruberi TaxID=5762 RepID=D2UYD8_NAEGR|nr:uncharacterized protein NAEGRDRAFT_34729 [Naegleria gruberi]EFC50775.1 hypothetical protein NAEGRDRAFT_34729 [Naegleria gruberi]|eukprot:XP_002683519.1 hypothetical protein NAEGRDRAFT_34729 [Naegleria gruberi strain NEG-M]